MLKFQSKFAQSSKVSCEWEIYASIFKTDENPKLQTIPTSVPDIPGLKWWLTAFPNADSKFFNYKFFSIDLEIETESAVYASFSLQIKGIDYKRTKEHHKFEAGKSSFKEWHDFIPRHHMLQEYLYQKYFKDGKLTLVFEAEFYRPGAIQNVQIQEGFFF